MLPSAILPEEFSTEADYDQLMIGSEYYDGSSGPVGGVVPTEQPTYLISDDLQIAHYI